MILTSAPSGCGRSSRAAGGSHARSWSRSSQRAKPTSSPSSLNLICSTCCANSSGGRPKIELSSATGPLANEHATFTAEAADQAAVANDFSAYVRRQLKTRRARVADPGDDMTSGLLALQVGGKQLSDDDIVSLLRNYVAGAGTTVAAMGIAALHVVEDPALQQRLRADALLVSAFVEEVLRCDGPLVANGRTALADAQIGGRTIPAGDHVSLMWIAANRDERVFPEPDAIRFDRKPALQLAFGAGIHTCLGAPLVRLEMRVALDAKQRDGPHSGREPAC